MAQSRLRDRLGKPREAESFQPSADYRPPAWRRGYDLARDSRDRLGVALEPIRSMRELVEHRLGIPIVQVKLPTAIAGATISSSGRRGIVLNTTGANTNVWIRRTTLAHELGHILYDPEGELSSVRVDSYEQLRRDTEDPDDSQYLVEQRANAFAVEFLAPREAVKQLVPDVARVNADAIGRVMHTFGIGRTAARYHVWNAWWRQAELPSEPSIRATPTDGQKAAEDSLLDYFPIEATPEQRRGRLALLATEAFDAGFITADTASQYLVCTESEFRSELPALRQLV